MRKLKLISILTPHNCKVCSRLTKFSRKRLQKLLLFWNKKTMRKKPRKKSNFKKTTLPKEKISNTSAIESNQFGSKTLDPKIEEKFKEASEDSSILKDETKSQLMEKMSF